MSEIRPLWLLPVITFVVSIIGIAVPCVIGGANGDLQWILPFISDGGAYAPEKNIFAMLQNISAVLIAITIYIKHVQFVVFYESRRSGFFWKFLSYIMTAIGLLAAFGLSLVGDFSEKDLSDVHNTVAGVTFGAAIVYIIFSTGLSFLRPLLCSLPVALLRVVLALLATGMLIFHTCVLEFDLFFPPDANITAYDGDDQPIFLDYDSPYFAHHTVATSTEWALGILIFAYFITIVEEFRKSSLTLPSINFNADQLLPVEKRPSGENQWN